MLRVANSCTWIRCFGRAKLRWKSHERALGSGALQGHRGDGPTGQAWRRDLSARILEYVGLRSKMYSILTVQPDGARKEKRKIKGVSKKAVTNVRHLEYREVLEEGSERRAAFAQLRSRAHEIAVETVEKKSLSPFNDKVYGLDAHLAAAGTLAKPLVQVPWPELGQVALQEENT